MSNKSKNTKLELNKDTLRTLVDLSTVHGGEGEGDPGVIVQVTKNNGGTRGGSWFLCCKNA